MAEPHAHVCRAMRQRSNGLHIAEKLPQRGVCGERSAGSKREVTLRLRLEEHAADSNPARLTVGEGQFHFRALRLAE